MPRTYITVKENGETELHKDNGNGFEGFMTGNTNFDDINNPITSFNFVLEVEGIYFMPLKSVRTFTKENEYEYIREGGVNDYVHMKRKPISKPFTFQVERYIGTERFLDPLANGTELVLPLLLYIYRHKATQGFSELAPKRPARIYVFTGCTVMSKEYGELNAEKSGLLTETTTIAYRELMVIPNPIDGIVEDEEWNPKDNPDYQDKLHGLKTKYAARAKTDDQNQSTYRYRWNDKGETIVSDLITKEMLNKPMWNGKSADVKWAKPQDVDKPANTIYTEETDADGIKHTVRNDTSDFNRAPYSIRDDGAKAKYAKKSPIDSEKAEIREPYSIKEDGAKAKYAKTPKNDSKRAKVRTPMNIKKDGAKAKYAQTSKKDSPTAKVREPYDIHSGAKPKHAATSGRDDERAEVVTYPPTRRALMADQLKQ